MIEYISKISLHMMFVLLLATACGGEGEEKKEDAKTNLPESVGDVVGPPERSPRDPIGTSVELSRGAALPQSKCTQERSLALQELPDDEPIVLDGQIEMQGGTEITSTNFSQWASIRFFKRGRDLYIFAKIKSGSSGELVLNGARYFNNTLNLSTSVKLAWNERKELFLYTSGQNIKLSGDGVDSVGGFFSGSRDRDTIEAVISSKHLDQITTNQVFWVEPALKASYTGGKLRSDIHRIFNGFYPVEGALHNVNSCLSWIGSRAGESIQVISFHNFKNGDQNGYSHNEFGSLRYLTSSLSKYLGWESQFQPITLITAPHKNIKMDQRWGNKSGVLVVSDDYLTGNALMVDEARHTSGKYVFQLVMDHLKRNNDFKSSIANRFLATALTHKFLRLVYGPLYVFDIKTLLWNELHNDPVSDEELLKIKIFASIFAEAMTLKEIKALTGDIKNLVALNINELAEAFGEISQTKFGKNHERLYELVRNVNEQTLPFATLSYVDHDHDGLFDALEHALGTDFTAKDSDGDGWLDSTEYFKGRNPNNLSDQPGTLIMDGFDNDWYTIIPQKLFENTFVNKECPASADITYYSALFGKGKVVVFGSARDSQVNDNERDARWFVDINIKDVDVVVEVTSRQDEDMLVLAWTQNGIKKSKMMYRNTTKSIYGVEWEIPVDDLGLGWLPETAAVEVKITTSFSDSKSDICDDTPWYEPLGI